MNRRRIVLLGLALAMMGGGVGWMLRMQAAQRLGDPGIRILEIPGSERAEILFPERVMGVDWEPQPVTEGEFGALPGDTSFGKRLVRAGDGFQCFINVVLMKADRTSIHKPQFCLTGQGWPIEESEATTIRMEEPHPYDLPVMKLTSTRQVKTPAGEIELKGIFVYWFVADGRLTGSHWERMRWMAEDLLTDGVLQRWAYIAYFSWCPPGAEEATYRRMEELIRESVPKFQTVAGEPSKPSGS